MIVYHYNPLLYTIIIALLIITFIEIGIYFL